MPIAHSILAIPKEQTVFRFTVPLVQRLEQDDHGHGNSDAGGNANGKDDSHADTSPCPRQEANEKDLVFELHGSQFRNRPVDRANKKFKWKNIDYV